MKSQKILSRNPTDTRTEIEGVNEITHGFLPSSPHVSTLSSPLPVAEGDLEKMFHPGADRVDASGTQSPVLRQADAEMPLQASDETPTSAGFVALSRFIIANGMTAEVKTAFRHRPHLVDSAPGYRRMEVISPLDRPEEIWLITFWADEASFRQWHHSHTYRESHRGIPKGLKLLPGETKISHFEHVSS